MGDKVAHVAIRWKEVKSHSCLDDVYLHIGMVDKQPLYTVTKHAHAQSKCEYCGSKI